ncbi:MAG: MMPL family transporter [Thermoguttaceae bacterium]|nr:MMPL family transporter [Thermoguttaceae bacterium]
MSSHDSNAQEISQKKTSVEVFLNLPLRWLILISFAFLSILLLYGGFEAQKTCNNKVVDWFPSDFPETQKMYFMTKNFGSNEMVLISWDGLAAEDTIQEKLAEAFLADPGLDANGKSLPSLVREVRTTSAFLRESNAMNKKRFSREAPPKPIDEISREQMRGWLLSKDLKQGCIIVMPTEEGSKDRSAFLKKLYDDTMRITGLTHRQIHLAGVSCDSVAIDEATKESNHTLLPIFMVLCSFTLALCLRNPILTLCVLCIAFVNQFIGPAVIYFSGSHMDSISLLVAALTFVLSMESGIHLSNYYRDSVIEGGRSGAVVRALKKGITPCALATITTVLGMGSLAISQVSPISNFGIYTSIALLLGTFFLFIFFGSYWENWGPFDFYLPFWPRRTDPLKKEKEIYEAARRTNPNEENAQETPVITKGAWYRLVHVISRIHWLIILVSIGGIVGFSTLITQLETNITIHGMLKSTNETIVDYNYLENHFGGLVPIEVQIRIPTNAANLRRTPLEKLELVAILQEKLDHIPGVDTTVSVLNVIPPPPSLTESSAAAVSARRVFNREIKQNLEKIRESGFMCMAPEEEIWRISSHVCAGADLKYEELLQKMELKIYETLLDHGITYSIQPDQIKAAPFLAVPAQKAGIQGLSSDYAAMENELRNLESADTKSLSPAEKRNHARRFAELDEMKFRDISVMISGAIPLVFKAQKQLLNDLIDSFLTAFILISITMILLQRSIIAGLIAMIPNVLPSIVVFGALAMFQIKVDIGSMMTASVALGITVDGTLHLLTWFQRGIRLGCNRKEAVIYAYTHCAEAMLQTAFICSFTFLVFAFSNFVPVARFAWMLCILLTAAICADLFLTPSLLLSPLGRFFVRKEIGKK